MQSDQQQPHSWQPVDLLAAGARRPEPPTICGLVYPSRVHLVSGEPDGCKSWLGGIVCASEIAAGRTAAYVDFEMQPSEMLERLRALGLTDPQIRGGFLYLRPTEPLEERAVIADLEQILDVEQPSVVVVDSFIGALALTKGDPNSSVDVERVYRTIVAPLRAHGAAVVILDHVVKNRDDRGKWATGSERKVGGADVHLSLEAIQPFGRGRTGRVKLTVGKDRPGWLPRPRAGELELVSDPDTGTVTWTIHPAASQERSTDDQDAGAWRPTVLEQRVVQHLKKHPEPITRSALANAVTGNRKYLLQAIDNLLTDGMLEQDGAKVGLADVPERSSERSEERISSGRNGHVPPSYIGNGNAERLNGTHPDSDLDALVGASQVAP